jgi:hypothetical protein
MKKNYSILFVAFLLFSFQSFSQCNGFAYGQAACSGGCTGKATVFGFGGTGPYTYLWSDGQSTSTATSLCAATYTVTISDNTGCTVSKTASVTVQPPPSITVASVDATCSTCADGEASVTPTGSGPFTYSWSPNTSSNDTAFALTPGTYTVCVTNIVTSCDSCATVVVGYVSGILDHTFINNNVKIFPNPVKDIATIQFNVNTTEQATLSVVNVLGAEVYSEKVEPLNHQTIQLNLKEIIPGVYFVNVKYRDFTIRQKLIKE